MSPENTIENVGKAPSATGDHPLAKQLAARFGGIAWQHVALYFWNWFGRCSVNVGLGRLPIVAESIVVSLRTVNSRRDERVVADSNHKIECNNCDNPQRRQRTPLER
jgi:hypothetical protein